jgi:hypothetical protein
MLWFLDGGDDEPRSVLIGLVAVPVGLWAVSVVIAKVLRVVYG